MKFLPENIIAVNIPIKNGIAAPLTVGNTPFDKGGEITVSHIDRDLLDALTRKLVFIPGYDIDETPDMLQHLTAHGKSPFLDVPAKLVDFTPTPDEEPIDDLDEAEEPAPIDPETIKPGEVADTTPPEEISEEDAKIATERTLVGEGAPLTSTPPAPADQTVESDDQQPTQEQIDAAKEAEETAAAERKLAEDEAALNAEIEAEERAKQQAELDAANGTDTDTSTDGQPAKKKR